MKEIIQEGNPVLRDIAEPISIANLPDKEVNRLIADMKEALADKPNGVALAAPQVGVSKQLFVVSEKVAADIGTDIPLIYINPEITKRSKNIDLLEEGCLSITDTYGSVPRSSQVTISAHNEDGKSFTWGASGLLAQIFQHEVDHLNGVLYIDTATETHNIIE